MCVASLFRLIYRRLLTSSCDQEALKHTAVTTLVVLFSLTVTFRLLLFNEKRFFVCVFTSRDICELGATEHIEDIELASLYVFRSISELLSYFMNYTFNDNSMVQSTMTSR